MGRKLTLRDRWTRPRWSALLTAKGWRANEPCESSSSELSQGNFHHPGEHWLCEETVLIIISWGLHVYHLLSQNQGCCWMQGSPHKSPISQTSSQDVECCWEVCENEPCSVWSLSSEGRHCTTEWTSGWCSGHRLQEAWVEPERHELFSMKSHWSLGRVPGASRTWASSTFLSVCLPFLLSLPPFSLVFVCLFVCLLGFSRQNFSV